METTKLTTVPSSGPTTKRVSLKRWATKLKDKLRGIPEISEFAFHGPSKSPWQPLRAEDGSLVGVSLDFSITLEDRPFNPIRAAFVIPVHSNSRVDQLLAELLADLLNTALARVEYVPTSRHGTVVLTKVPPSPGPDPALASSVPEDIKSGLKLQT